MKYWLWLWLWWCPLPVLAGQVMYRFEYPLALQEGTGYALRARVSVGSTLAVVEKPLTMLSLAQCQEPDAPITSDLLCGQTCLEPGDYTLQVYATGVDGRQSPLSNEFDLDLTQAERCLPPPVTLPPRPPRPAPSPPGPAVGAALAAAAAAVAAAFPGSTVPPLAQLYNPACVQWRIEGPCFCSTFNPCVQVSYWEPRWIVETAKKPGETVVPVLGNLLSPVLSALGLPLHGGGSGVSAGKAGATGLQFNEAHVYSFPQLLGGPCTSCAPSGGPPVLHYASELDPGWRAEPPALAGLSPLHQIGVWAPMYPRSGKSITGSEPVGSGVCAVRALDIAHKPLGTPPNVDVHVVTVPASGSSRCLQLASPIPSFCFPAGLPPNLWETGTLSVGGKYLWVFWHKQTCCRPDPIPCGIVVPPLGGHGGNACDVDPTQAVAVPAP